MGRKVWCQTHHILYSRLILHHHWVARSAFWSFEDEAMVGIKKGVFKVQYSSLQLPTAQLRLFGLVWFQRLRRVVAARHT